MKINGRTIALGEFVTCAKVNFINSTKSIKSHMETEYHKFYATAAKQLLRSTSDPRENLRAISEIATKKNLENARVVLNGVIDTVKFLGKNSIAFRGHSDSGLINLSNNAKKQGNFK